MNRKRKKVEMTYRESRYMRERYARRARERRRRRRKRLLAAAGALALTLVLVICVAAAIWILGRGQHAAVDNGTDTGRYEQKGASVELSRLYSRCAVLTDASTGEVLAEKASRERIYPASMTKIMTALLAIEYTENLDQTVTVPEEIFPALYAGDASMAGFQPGEEASLKDLYTVSFSPPERNALPRPLLCASPAHEEAFAGLMNQKAEKLGMDGTHFCNSTGLHEVEHDTTAADVAVLLRYALNNPVFREVFTSASHTVGPTNLHPQGFTFTSTMFSQMDSPMVNGGEILGGKTGYTEQAGQCLASLAEINGQGYILVTAKADGNHETSQFHILDAQDVYNQIGIRYTD